MNLQETIIRILREQDNNETFNPHYENYLDAWLGVGRLDKKEENGKTLYSIKGNNEFKPSSEFRGHFSAFFNSAVLAGIIAYDKEGQKYYIKKGPNFEDFVRGELTSL